MLKYCLPKLGIYFRFIRSLVLVIGLVVIAQACSKPASYEEYLQSLYSETVPLIGPERLDSMMAQDEQLYLLDTRSRKEYQVSHIHGAQRVGYNNFQEKALADVPKEAEVVVYCTVGYRSEKIGEKLQEQGYQNVYNLYGSILKWKNKGYPVVDTTGQETQNVHTHSKQHSKWLENGKAVHP